MPTTEEEAKELAKQAQDKFNEGAKKRTEACQQDIAVVLKKYNCNLQIVHTIQVIPVQEE